MLYHHSAPVCSLFTDRRGSLLIEAAQKIRFFCSKYNGNISEPDSCGVTEETALLILS
jgi:hypothetical protein